MFQILWRQRYRATCWRLQSCKLCFEHAEDFLMGHKLYK